MVSAATLALLFTTAIATPVARQTTIPEGWKWQVTNWEGGCGRSGCYYNFNVTVPSIENQLGVLAYCSGSEQGYDNSFTIPSTYVQCKTLAGGDNVAAARLSLREPGQGPKEIDVSFVLPGNPNSDPPRPAYNFSGSHEAKYNQFVSPPFNFTITPDKVFGVA
ncbi:hypothetical protein E8E13_011081 [Curvularia kusanoi]|uniref:Uncharacterized protein n=1 Tax=Curvularia kusanoi TaxID=90978 RepID=A0A9P4TIL3_CURKU|nr:hypothetical protein E8E13_011081 [Curvularia kusanoi]